MKLKISKKDLKALVVFGIILVYIVAILVVNFYHYFDTNEFFGFNPIPAFTEYLPATILIYLLFVFVIFNGIKDKIIKKDKGIGFKFDVKESNGYSKWAEAKEMKKSLTRIYVDEPTIEAAGIPIISDGEEVWVDNGESHSLIIGSTGSGKTRRLVDPMIKILAKNNESIILTDPKGELYEGNGELLKSLGYQIIVLNFRNPEKGNAWNPLRLPYDLYAEGNKDKSIEVLDDLATNIIGQENKSDPFWENSAADYFTGLSLALFEDATIEQVNLNSINLMATIGEEKIRPNLNYIQDYFSTKDPSKPAHINASTVINSPSDTKGGILSVFKQKIKLFSSRDNLSEMLSHNDFDMKSIGAKKTAVFIIIQDEKKTLHPLATIFVKQCYETLIDFAQDNGGKLPVRTNFILDEFANMPALKDVTTMVTAARSRQIRFNFIIQNFAQLYQVYGKENGETIKGNCTNLIYLLSTELAALEEISKLCGEVQVKGKDGKPDSTKPLITISDLQMLKMGQTIIKRHRNNPFKVTLPDKSKYKFGLDETKKADYITRERVNIGLFDLKGYIDKKKKADKEKSEKELLDLIHGTSSKGKDFKPNFDKLPSNPPAFDPSMLAGLDDEESINEMIKKIDEQIAILEKEEKEQNLKAENDSNLKTDDNKIVETDEIIDIEDTVSLNNDKIKDMISKSDVKEAGANNTISDDQFFDDFFMDD